MKIYTIKNPYITLYRHYIGLKQFMRWPLLAVQRILLKTNRRPLGGAERTIEVLYLSLDPWSTSPARSHEFSNLEIYTLNPLILHYMDTTED